MLFLQEDILTQIERHVTLTAVLAVLGFTFAQHKIWVRMQDRLNAVWHEYCDRHNIPFEKLENGKTLGD